MLMSMVMASTLVTNMFFITKGKLQLLSKEKKWLEVGKGAWLKANGERRERAEELGGGC